MGDSLLPHWLLGDGPVCKTRSVVFIPPMQGVRDIGSRGIGTRRSSCRRQPARRSSLSEFILEELNSPLQSSTTLELHDSSSHLLPTEGHIYHTQSQWSAVLQDQPSTARAQAQVLPAAAYDFFPRLAQTSLIRFWAAATDDSSHECAAERHCRRPRCLQ